MPREDYDIESLAVYLHQDPVKVRRMAERGAKRSFMDSANEFYRKIGAFPLDQWTTFRLTGKALYDLAHE